LTDSKNTVKPEKVFDTSGMEASLTKNSLIDSFDNSQEESTQNSNSSQAANLDAKADAIVNLNGIPISPSTGTTRAALLQSDKQSNTIQVNEDSHITTYR
jgi:NAD dependent epimerase/dehydratase family enzyme